MYCTKCGKSINEDDKYCSNCGKEISNLVNEPENVSKDTKVTAENGKINIKYSENEKNIASKVIGAIALSGVIGFFTYGISNQVLGINETDIKNMNFPPNYMVVPEKDNVFYWQEYVKSWSFDYALYASIGFLVLSFIFIFLRFEKTDNKESQHSQ